jgi:hypothetical protein
MKCKIPSYNILTLRYAAGVCRYPRELLPLHGRRYVTCTGVCPASIIHIHRPNLKYEAGDFVNRARDLASVRLRS